MKKRVFCFLLALCMMVSLMPGAVFAEEPATEESAYEESINGEAVGGFESDDPEWADEEPAVTLDWEAADWAEESDPTDEFDPMDAADPTDEFDPATEAEPMDEFNPAGEAETTESAEPMDDANSADTAEPIDEFEPGAEHEPMDETDPADTAEPTDEFEPAAEAEPADEAEPMEFADPADPADPIETEEAADPEEPSEEEQATEEFIKKTAEEDTEEENVTEETAAEEQSEPGQPEETAAEDRTDEPSSPAEPVEEDSNEEEVLEQPVAELVKVIFKPVPENAAVVVYGKKDGDKVIFEAEEDGSYLLFPGEYYYDAEAEGCVSLEEIELHVFESEEPVEIPLKLTPAENQEEEPVEKEIKGRVQVFFKISPEEADVRTEVFRRGDKGEKLEIEAEKDESYLLLPGTYYYSCHDETGAYAEIEETELRVEETEQNTLTIEITLTPIVSVVFESEDAEVLSGLSVLDNEGNVMEPVDDQTTGEVLYGNYRLIPGTYRYRYHDESGIWKDLEETVFQVEAGEKETRIHLSLESLWNSYYRINPICPDIVTEDDLPEILLPATSQANDSLHASEAAMMGTVHTSVASAGKELRKHLVNRNTDQFTIYYKASGSLNEDQQHKMLDNVFAAAVEHTGVPYEGDYIDFQYGIWRCQYQYDSANLYTIVYRCTYYTTASQENVMTNKVNSILSSLNLSGKSDYQKIYAIYHYLTENVSYDYYHYENDRYYELQYTGYAALVQGVAVCQGYAVAFYRLCLEAGIDVRVVDSSAEDHAWNIVQLGGKYYEMDATWDRKDNSYGEYWYFLRGSSFWLEEHGVIGNLGAYEIMPCNYQYTISQTDYDVSQEKTPVITTQPASVSVNAEGIVTFKITATGGGLSYQWQVRTSSSGSWANSKASGYNTATCKPNVLFSNNGSQYRCVVRNSRGTVYSNAATLTIKPPKPTITKHPSSVTVYEGTQVTLTVTATGKSLSYQWQVRANKDADWINSSVSSAKTASMTFTPSDAINGYQYRCAVTNGGGTVYSNVATLTVNSVATTKPVITRQPTSVKVNVGTKVTLTVAATGGGLSYQWQVRANSDANWNNSSISSAKTTTMVFTPSDSLNGYQYRCRVTNSYGTTYSNTAVLTINSTATAKPTITRQPASTSVNVGSKVTLVVTATGGGLSYQWQVRANSSANWSNSSISSAKTTTMVFTPSDALNGYQYRCAVKNSYGTTCSNVATITVKSTATAAPTVTTQPKSTSVTAGKKASFQVIASGGGLSYQWQVFDTPTNAWENSSIASANSNTLAFTANDGQNGLKYRCRITNSRGSTYSNVVTLTVNSTATAAPTVTTQPKSMSVTAGARAYFQVFASGGGLSYQWQVYDVPTGLWENSSIASAKSNTLAFTTNSGQNGLKYRCLITNSKGSTYSNVVILTVK